MTNSILFIAILGAGIAIGILLQFWIELTRGKQFEDAAEVQAVASRYESGIIAARQRDERLRGADKPKSRQYDYTNQAWLVNGRYQRCGHVLSPCICYGRLHEGEPAAEGASIH